MKGIACQGGKEESEKIQLPRARGPSRTKNLLMMQYTQVPLTRHRCSGGPKECWSPCPIIHCKVDSAGQGVYSECDLCSSQRPKATLCFRTSFPPKMHICLYTQTLLLFSMNFWTLEANPLALPFHLMDYAVQVKNYWFNV